MGKAEALKVLERLLPSGAADAERAVLRSEPEKYKQYLSALDTAHGSRSGRATNLGFSETPSYHGSPSSEIDSFNLKNAKSGQYHGKGVYTTKSPEEASIYAESYLPDESVSDYHEGASVYPVRLRNGNGVSTEEITARGLDSKTPAQKTAALKKAGYDSVNVSDNIDVTFDPSKIRSTNAAFDPRFKDSADILALAGNQAPKIAARMIRPKMNLGDAFNSIAEPIAAIDKPVNELVSAGADRFAQLTDLKRGAGAGVDQNYEPIAKSAFNNFVGAVTPTPSSLMLGKTGSLLKMAGQAPRVAETMLPKPQSMAEIYRDAKAGIKAATGFGTVVAKETPKINYGTVTVKDVPATGYGKVTVLP